MNEETQPALAVLTAAGLKLGRNWRRELGELIADIAKRDSLSPDDVVADAAIKAALSSNAATAKKRDLVIDILRQRRYPRYYRARAAFSDKLKALKPAPNIKITPPPSFEGHKIKVEFTYSTPAELDEAIESLRRLKGVDLINEALAAAQDSG